MTFGKKLCLFLAFIALCFGIYFFTYMHNNTYYVPSKTKVVIIGGTSGIGKEMAREFVNRGFTVGITGRRENLLNEIKKELGEHIYTHRMDIAQPTEARLALQDLITEIGGMDIIIINAGIGTTRMEWEEQKKMVDVNVTGFLAMASAASDYFMQTGSGHIVGISSIAALRGMSSAPAYSASKAFISNYLAGLRAHYEKNNKTVYVTTIEPGLIETDMGKVTSDSTGWHVVDRAKNCITNFLKSTSTEAAVQICDVIDARQEHAYSTARWRIVAWLFKFLPDAIFYTLI